MTPVSIVTSWAPYLKVLLAFTLGSLEEMSGRSSGKRKLIDCARNGGSENVQSRANRL
jgi:hypothetical protein